MYKLAANRPTITTVKCSTKAQKTKEFSVCVYIPYFSEARRELGDVDAEGIGYGSMDGAGYFRGLNLAMNYVSAILYDCDSGDELGTYGVFCQGDINQYAFLGSAVQSDCEHNFAFTGGNKLDDDELGSAIVIHTSEGLLGRTVTTVGGSGKFYKSEVVDVKFFSDDDEEGFTFTYKTRGYNPLYWKDVSGHKIEKNKKM